MSFLRDMEHQQLADRGMRDAVAGKLPASEHGVYTTAYQFGTLFRRATQQQIALSFDMKSRCPGCGALYPREYEGCAHPDGKVFELDPGLMICHGAADEYDEPDFVSGRRLRQLAASGVQVFDEEGDDITPIILMQ